MKPDPTEKFILGSDGSPLSFEDILRLSENGSELSELTGSGYSVSDRVTEAVIRPNSIKEGNQTRYRLSPFARINRRGVEVFVEAGLIGHNPADYVLYEGTIIPFPKDFTDAFYRLADGNISVPLPRIVRLMNQDPDKCDLEVIAPVFDKGIETASRFSSLLDIRGLNASLYPYQAQGVQWLNTILAETGGAILADEMGLGKTVQIIGALLLTKPTRSEPALVVCPTSLIENWCRELTRFAPGLSFHVHRGSLRTGIPSGLTVAHVVITTYDTLVGDQLVFERVRWSYLIADEAQALKNPTSKRRQAFAALNRDRMLAVTGTPVENTLLDLWSLTDLCIPGILGSKTEFELKFPDNQESAVHLSSLTGPIVLKRKVADVASDLPERIACDIPLRLPEDLARRYELLRAQIIDKYPKAGALVATGQLQLFCAHPSLHGNFSEEFEEDTVLIQPAEESIITPKIERAIAILEEAFLSGRKVLLFSVFNAVGKILREIATSTGIPDAMWGAINGSTPQEDRQAIVDEFSEHSGPAVLILNPKAAGAGLNITAANVVIHFVPVWNPAIEAQASARAHRRGQKFPVTIYRLFYEGTVEEVMLERTNWKNGLAGDAVVITKERDSEDLARALKISPFSIASSP
jgi:SNF2 family DNA or RNA helicase